MRATGLVASLFLVVSAMPARAADAGALFAQRCAACHKSGPKSTASGPSLAGVWGRRIASLGDFSYSPGLKAKSGQTWGAANLAAFLGSPAAFAPATKMFAGPLAPAERGAIIDYLKGLK
ncbi:MAG: c-type cytochrome [Caulobacteraceae bacterium]